MSIINKFIAWFRQKYRFRIVLYIIIIVLFWNLNLTSLDRYMISRNPLTFLTTNWFEIVVIFLLLAIYYQILNKND